MALIKPANRITIEWRRIHKLQRLQRVTSVIVSLFTILYYFFLAVVTVVNLNKNKDDLIMCNLMLR
jgi:hypothetical protein